MTTIPALRKLARPFDDTKGYPITQPFANIFDAEPECYYYGSGLYGFSWAPGASRNTSHLGIDYGLPCGTPLLAAAAGTVHSAGWDETGFGNLTILDHGGGLLTFHAHQSEIQVQPGQQIAARQQIGLSGTTGNSTGCHLHWATATPSPDGYYDFFDPAPFVFYQPTPVGGPTAGKYTLLVDMHLRTAPKKDALQGALIKKGAVVTAHGGWTTSWREIKTDDGHDGWLLATNLTSAA